MAFILFGFGTYYYSVVIPLSRHCAHASSELDTLYHQGLQITDVNNRLQKPTSKCIYPIGHYNILILSCNYKNIKITTIYYRD